jgi:hypothetical protein
MRDVREKNAADKAKKRQQEECDLPREKYPISSLHPAARD